MSETSQQFVARLRVRLHDRRFWDVQALVLVITALHATLEITEALGHRSSLAFVPVSLYLLPVLYAGFNFGIAGTLPTALWVILLTFPNAVFWHDSMERAGEFFQLTVLVVLGVLIARRVDREAQAKERAERAGARLAQLNATAAAASRTLEYSQVVGDTLQTVLKQSKVDLAWIAFAEEVIDSPPLAVASRSGAHMADLTGACAAVTRAALADGRPHLERRDTNATADPAANPEAIVVAPIQAADGMIGVIGIANYRYTLSIDDLSLLEAVAHQLAIALDNIRHYQEATRALAELTRAQDDLVAYLRMAIGAQEEERKRLARDLHDETIQCLVVIKAELDALTAEKRLSATAHARLDRVTAMVQTAVDDVRRFSRNLRPSILDDLGLVHAVDWLLADLSHRTGVQVSLDVEGEPRRFAADAEVAVYRIVQEALHNAEKHSGASRVATSLTFGPDAITVGVADDGRGFDLDAALARRADGAGLGLLGMQERARLMGGTLAIDSRPSAGTRVTLNTASATTCPSPSVVAPIPVR